MDNQELIKVPERGQREVNRDTWRKLSANDAFWQLVDQNRISVTQLSHGRVQLKGASYVGRAEFDDVVLELTEKIPGATAALLHFASADAFRVDSVIAPASDLGTLAGLLVHQFINSVRQYVSAGREFRYSKKHFVGSLIGGRIDMTGTISLRARGLKHLVAFDQNTISRDTDKNRVLLAALRETEILNELVKIAADDISSARALSMLFSDCTDVEILFGRRERFADLARSLAAQPEQKPSSDMLMLASVLLSHESFEYAKPIIGNLPSAWFLNLETLFQKAIKQILSDLLSPSISVYGGTYFQRSIFDKNGEDIANPDFVLDSEIQALIVGDVKYKDWSGSARRSDLYQLLVHAAAFEANSCCLVYPNDKFEAVDLGTAVTGSKTWLFGLDILNLRDSLSQSISKLIAA